MEPPILGEPELKKKFPVGKVFATHFHLNPLLRPHCPEKNLRYCLKFSIFSELTFSDRRLQIKQNLQNNEPGPRGIKALGTESGGEIVMGTALQREIATSFPISQKLNGGNKISEAV